MARSPGSLYMYGTREELEGEQSFVKEFADVR